MDLEKHIVSHEVNIIEAMKVLDAGALGFICIEENNKIYGVVTDGDIRRAIINNTSLEEPISKISNFNFSYLEPGYSRAEADKLFKEKKIKRIPILQNSRLVDILTEEHFYNIDELAKYNKIDATVVIMAGGKGTRLKPFTDILPKPIFPLGIKA